MTTVAKIVESIKSLTVSDLVVLIDELAAALGVDKAALSAAPAAAAPAAAAPAEAAAQTEFDVVLVSVGEGKINVIKAVREIAILGLKEAKELVETPNCVIKAKCSKEEADKIQAQLKDAGATCVLK